MATIEQKELEGHRSEIIADVKILVEKYRAIFDWDVPEIDQDAADKLILVEMRKALDDIEKQGSLGESVGGFGRFFTRHSYFPADQISRPRWTRHLPTGQACVQPLRGA